MRLIDKDKIYSDLYDADAITFKGLRMLANADEVDAVAVVHAHLVNFAGDCQLLWQCSECECTTVPYWSKFCPNCGAKIDGEVTPTNIIPTVEVSL